ncbi:MAG: hypothetical protein BWY32_02591 [bacterium ADurb.Bin243]|nr:MAG: hypothetical protein BWY32_02591 [bacterium ADurb.Bin243]HOD42201.1 DUF445 domain-containing protein [Candidatus Wallbacteria bacterium]
MKKYFNIAYLAPGSLVLAMAGYLMTLNSSAGASKMMHAFFEAAMVGGLADWFAVVALFRHPLNLPIPHTSIIKKNRRKITDRIVEMLQTQWLTKDAILKRLENYDFSAEIADALLFNGNEDAMGFFEFLTDEFERTLLKSKDAANGIDFNKITGAVEAEMAAVDFKTPLAGALNSNIDTFRLIIINEIDTWLLMPDTNFVLREKLKKIILSYAQKYEIIKTAVEFGETIGVLNYDSLALELIKLLGAELESARSDENHEFNAQLRHALKNMIDKIKENQMIDALPSLMVRYAVEKIDFARAAAKIVSENKKAIAGYLFETARAAAGELKTNEEAKKKFNFWLKNKISVFINENHSQIGDIVRSNIDGVNDDELVSQIEEKVGDDLQYIRLNGAIVGGLVGLLIYIFKNYISF